MKDIVRKNALHNKEMGYGKIHRMACYYISKLGIRPNACPICGYEGTVVAHHPDYDKPYEIIFCCPSCHKLIHHGEVDVGESDIICLCKTENGRVIDKCLRCGKEIEKVGGRKYCKECSIITMKKKKKNCK